MKRKATIFVSIIIVSLALLSFFAFYSFPAKISGNIEGVLYQCNNGEFSENLTLEIDGHYYRNLFKGNEFLGIFNVMGLDIEGSPERRGNVSIRFNKNNQGSLYYLNNDQGDWQHIGVVYFSIPGPQVVLLVHEQADSGTQWGSDNGFVFAAPAVTRDQALEITNNFMDYVLETPIK
ncbi:MAG: hypothetical protein JXN10_08330 [Clostridia bacterium]|nr:hypothetical protein [Clostridia bacterium]MBN2883522.1 hypothetical protein [Clostridia bacterium]